MPIYAYRCAACGHAQDVLQKMSDPLLTRCPACGAEAYTKQVTAAGFQLKGSGWYVTDFRGGNNAAKKEAKEDGKADGGDSKAADKPGEQPSDKGADKAVDKTMAKPEKAADKAAAPAAAPASGPSPAPPPSSSSGS